MSAAKLVSAFSGVNPRLVVNDGTALELLNSLLYWCLNNNRYDLAAQMLWGDNLFSFKPRCTRMVWEEMKKNSSLLLMGSASTSKCLGPDTPVRREDGSVALAKDVAVGDRLAGDDGTGRTVLHVVKGEAEMFEIQPKGAPAFTCNGDHILSLKCSWTRRNHSGRYGVSSGYTPGKIVDVPLREYLGWSKNKKRAYRLFSKPAVLPEHPVEVDPYIYGAWLGDGTCCRAELTTPEGPMQREWCRYWAEEGFEVERVENASKACPSWFVRPEIRGTKAWPNEWFRGRLVDGGKRIGHEYLSNSVENRLKLLAGLIDSDGCWVTGGFDVVSKWAGLASDIAELARGLGFRVSECLRTHSIKGTGFFGDAWGKSPLFVVGSRHSLTNSKKGHIQIGCKCATFDWWKQNGREFALANGYTEDEIAEYTALVKLFCRVGK
jgi:hypothetical protein